MPQLERRNLVLFLIGLLVAVAGWQIGPGSVPAPRSEVGRGQLVFPGLAAKLAGVRRIDIENAGKIMVLRPRPGAGGEWGLESKGLYPVQTDKLRAMLTGLTLIRQVEPRTANPALYSKIGVEDAGAADGASTQVTLYGANGHVVAALIVGHKRVRAQGGLPDELYIRRPGHHRSWLAEGALSIDANPQLWLRRGIVDIPRDRIASISVTRDGTTLDFAPKDRKLQLTSPADHPPVDPFKLDDVYGALQALTLDDVAPAASEAGKPVGSAVFRTTDGLVITVHAFRDGPHFWAQFAASGKGAAPIKARVGGWSYELGSWMEKQLVPSLADLKPTPPAGQTPAATPAPATPAPATPATPTGK